MYKALSVTVLLLAIFAFASGSKSVEALPANPTFPIIVAKGALTNQTEPFSATIYTPPTDGLFRLSVYAAITTADPASNSTWSYSFNWTDASGKTESVSGLLQGSGSELGGFYPYNSNLGFQAGPSETFQANKGTPITHSMTLEGPPDSSVYAVYYTLERLE